MVSPWEIALSQGIGQGKHIYVRMNADVCTGAAPVGGTNNMRVTVHNAAVAKAGGSILLCWCPVNAGAYRWEGKRC